MNTIPAIKIPVTGTIRCSIVPADTAEALYMKGANLQMSVLDEDLIYEILSAVSEIPPGKVASYGQIARLIGRERNARLVGKVLSAAKQYGEYPCHRVVNSIGRLAPGFRDQRLLLEQEGVGFLPNGCVDLKHFRWEC